MSRCCLVVQKVSYAHIKNVVHFVHGTLMDAFDPQASLLICEEIDDAQHADDMTVFVIGENFARHIRRPGCRYVYLNFSIVAVMGSPLKMSREGWSAIRRKRRMLRDKLDLFDVVLDYFPPQTRRLDGQLDRPVRGFSIAVNPTLIEAQIPLQDRTYDICFVGGMTPRRLAVIDQLKALGHSISPNTGVVFEDIAARSRCCLNIHAHRSNHLETPRIVGALAVGTPVITEQSYGLQTLLTSDLCVAAPINRLADVTADLLGNPKALNALRIRSTRWYMGTYLPDCRKQWAEICSDLIGGAAFDAMSSRSGSAWKRERPPQDLRSDF